MTLDALVCAIVMRHWRTMDSNGTYDMETRLKLRFLNLWANRGHR